ncbi:MAG: hypothetical protein HY866_09680, partial [Chloroflexi bacterium]|nr:hypothetical protein [Chloroflexota bacterium]
MPVELQAWVGHLLVVGGRAVRIPPPGALAETAPKRAARVREGDVFFILVTAAAETHLPAVFFQEMAQLGADVYFGSSGTITSGLRDTLTTLHHALLEQAERPQLHALALVLRGEELYAARSGRIFAGLRQGETLDCFPTQRSDPLVMNLPPLGSGSAPEIQLGRFTVAPGQTLLLGDASLIDTPDDTLLSALGGATIPAVLDQIKTLAGTQTAASVIHFDAPGGSDPGGAIPQPSVRTPHAPLSRSSKPAAPAPVPAAPVTSSAPAAPAPIAAPVPPAPLPPAPVNEAEKTVLPLESQVVARVDHPAMPETSTPDKAAEIVTPFEPGHVAPFSLDEEPAPPSGSTAPFAPETLDDMAGEQEPMPRGPSPLQQARLTLRRTWRNGLRLTLAAIVGTLDFLTRTLNNVLPQPGQDGKQGISTNVAIATAILIPVVIVVVVLGLTLSDYDRSDFETYLERAQAAHDEAKKLSGENCESVAVRPLWTEALRQAELAAKYRPNDPNVLVIRADAQNYLDC